ncbi:MAG: 50S ribosomal protein L32 [Patescibacteria group bacterium]
MVVRMRHTKSQRNRRRSHHALKQKAFSLCKNCKTKILPHIVCVNCGYYNGKKMIDVLAKATKKGAKKSKKVKAEEKESHDEHKH